MPFATLNKKNYFIQEKNKGFIFTQLKTSATRRIKAEVNVDTILHKDNLKQWKDN